MEPTYYFLNLDFDLANFVFTGKTQIKIHTNETISKITLNAKTLNILSSKVKSNEEYVTCKFESNDDKEELIIKFPYSVQGDFEVLIHYKGDINDRLLGLYRSSYNVEGHEGPKYIATTHIGILFIRRQNNSKSPI